jgi:homospermidine synthase
MEGSFHGFLITHSESIAIADAYTLRDASGHPVYRPTVHYAYHPCDAAVLSLHELAGKNMRMPASKRVMSEELAGGVDELGVLLMGVDPRTDRPFTFWYGSQLDIGEARKMAEYNSATSLQVTATVVSGLIYCLKNPGRGIIEPDNIPHGEILPLALPYIQPVVGKYTDWTPIEGRNALGFAEKIDSSSPFQFSNVRV